MSDPLHIVEYEGPFMREDGWQHLRGGVRVREATQEEIRSQITIDRGRAFDANPCAFCGHSDARHRIVDAIAERVAAGEPQDEVLHDYGWSAAKYVAVSREVAEGELGEDEG